MEKLKQKRSRVSTAVGGNRQIQKQKTVPKLASECRSCSHGASNEDLFMLDRGQGLPKQVTGTPMKKLLDEEMSKETVSKKRSPSVIAKLMGLDGLSSPQPTHRQQRNLSDSYPDRASSVGDRRNMKMYVGKKNSLEQQEFKDVYVDPEASHVANHHCLSKHNVNSVTKQQLGWIQKRCDEREYAEIHSKHEGVDSNTDLMLKFLHQPNSLFVKHLNDQPGVPSSSLCSHIALLKPSTSLNYETDKRWKDERQSRRNRNTGSHRKHEIGLSGYCYGDHDTGPHRRDKDADLSYSWSRGTDNIHGSSRIRVMRRRESDIEPTRIVVLKPNLEKMHDVTKIISSPDDRRRHAECFDISPISNINSVAEEAGSWKNKGSSIEFRSSSQKSKEAREMAREITNQIRDNICNGHIDTPYSEVKRYLRDDSFYNTFESDSARESEVILPTSRSSFKWNERCKLSPSFVSESCTSKEAKNRMSERWKMTHGHKDIEMVGKGSTLGEMLSIPAREMRSENMGLEGARNKFASPTRWPTPSGISIMDGWRDGYLSLRSPSPSFDNQNNKASICCEALADETLFIHEEIVTQGRNNGTTGNFDQRDKTTSKNVRCSKKVQSSQDGYVCNTGFTDVSQYSCSIETPVEISFGKKDPTEQQLLVSYAHDSDSSTSAIVDAMLNNEVTMSCDSSSELLLKLPTCTFGDEDFYALDQDNLNLQELSNGKSEGSPVSLQLPGSEPEFSESSKLSDHHSPVSVLDVPSIDDVSPGSDCFERVNADLHELRRHLQLLKMESGSSSEMPTLFSNDEELVKGTISNSDRWEAAYIVDVLRASGFYETDPDSFTKTWYSTESPLGPWLFLSLEKHSDNETGRSRSERKLLYDRINMALSEVFWWAMNSYPLIRPSRIVAGLKLQTTEIEDQLHKVLADQEKEAEEVLEKVLDKEMKWFGCGDYISVVGNEVEEELLNDLVCELLTV